MGSYVGSSWFQLLLDLETYEGEGILCDLGNKEHFPFARDFSKVLLREVSCQNLEELILHDCLCVKSSLFLGKALSVGAPLTLRHLILDSVWHIGLLLGMYNRGRLLLPNLQNLGIHILRNCKRAWLLLASRLAGFVPEFSVEACYTTRISEVEDILRIGYRSTKVKNIYLGVGYYSVAKRAYFAKIGAPFLWD